MLKRKDMDLNFRKCSVQRRINREMQYHENPDKNAYLTDKRLEWVDQMMKIEFRLKNNSPSREYKQRKS